MPFQLNKILCSSIFCWLFLTATAAGDWSPDFMSRIQALSCRPANLKVNVTFLHAMKSGHFTKLGKTADMEVCALLCCEMSKCEAAFMARNNCYAVTCFSEHHCATAPARNNKWQPVIAFVRRIQTTESLAKKEGNLKERARAFSLDQIPRSPLSTTSEYGNAKLNKALDIEDQENMFYDDRSRQNKFLVNAGDMPGSSTNLDTLQRLSAQHKNSHEKKAPNIQYSIVTAAVGTCLVAFLLSGIAFMATRIRSRQKLKDSERIKTQYPAISTAP